jgi:phage I-like protein
VTFGLPCAVTLELFERGLLSGMMLAADLGERRVAVLLDIASASPPSRFRVLAKGVTATTKGPILFDEQAATSVMAAFEEQGLDELPFDVGHGMLNPLAPPSAHEAYGWFKPEVRDGALWASDIQWTADALTALRARKFRYFSPAVMRDVKTNRAMQLINIALTNIPATRGQAPLMASSAAVPFAASAQSTTARKPMTEAKLVLLQNPSLRDLDRAAIEVLSDTELKLIHLSGVTPADFLAEKLRLSKPQANNGAV